MPRIGVLFLAAAVLLTGARCRSSEPRRLEAAEIDDLARALKALRYPIRKKEFWSKVPVDRRDLKPGRSGLTTGSIWEDYLIADDRYLSLHTRCDDRPDVEDWIDHAGVHEIPGHPWTPEPRP